MKIDIEANKNSITIYVNNRQVGDYLIKELAATRGSNKLSDVIIHFSGKTYPDINSMEKRNELLIPLAIEIEKYHQNRINWFDTFMLVEEELNLAADDSFDEEEDFMTEENVCKILDDEYSIRREIKNLDTEKFVQTYLTENQLPLYNK